MTPRELHICAEGYRDELKARRENDQRSLYNLGIIIRQMVWAREAPSYEEIYGHHEKEEMTDEQMYANVRALNALLGGEEN